MKNILKAFIFFLFIGIVFYVFYLFVLKVPEKLNSKGNTIASYATYIKSYKVKSGSNAYYEILCHETPYEIIGGNSESQVSGDKYEVEIDSMDCDHNLIKYHTPIILDSENFLPAEAVITLTIDTEVMSLIKFKYEIKGTKYSRIQYMQPGWKKRSPQIKKDQTIAILYWDKNPQRAVLSEFVKYIEFSHL